MLKFMNVVVTDGVLDLQLEASINSAIIAGIVIKSEKTAGGKALRISQDEEVVPVFAKNEEIGVLGTKAKLYPNPAASRTTLEIAGEVTNLLIHSLNGQLIANYDPQMLMSERGKYVIPLSGISQGLYIVSVTNDRSVVGKFRLWVTH